MRSNATTSDTSGISEVRLQQPAEPALTEREATEVDARQDELMASESADGRPPSHQQRTTGWRWVAFGFPVVLIGAVTWALVRDVSVAAVFGFGTLFFLLLLLAGWPVWSASRLRGQEEAVARKEAIDELHPADERR